MVGRKSDRRDGAPREKTQALRARLRAVNIEYSELVRKRPTPDSIARLKQLKLERQDLMTLLAGDAPSDKQDALVRSPR